MAVLLLGLMGGLGVVNPAFGQSFGGPSEDYDGECDTQTCVDEFPKYYCAGGPPGKPTGVTGDVRDYVSVGKGVLPVVSEQPRSGAPRCHSMLRRLRVYRWPLPW